jgi:integrase/recombinase XerD
MLRHAFATNLVAVGATPEILRRQMRHHDVSVSLRYYVQTTQADIASTVAKLSSSHSL